MGISSTTKSFRKQLMYGLFEFPEAGKYKQNTFRYIKYSKYFSFAQVCCNQNAILFLPCSTFQCLQSFYSLICSVLIAVVWLAE